MPVGDLLIPLLFWVRKFTIHIEFIKKIVGEICQGFAKMAWYYDTEGTTNASKELYSNYNLS